MVFSSNLFLFFFLPVFLMAYSIACPAGRNLVLLIASVIFYAFGSGAIAWILIASVFFNDAAARLLANPGRLPRRPLFIGAVIINLLPLFYYKYFAFTMTTLVVAGAPVWVDPIVYTGIALPIGISFFTFQAISYLADVYTGWTKPADTLLEFGMYHTLFPQLVAGPIVRYVEIKEAVKSRRFDLAQLAEGGCRFCIGLGKKVILADNLAVVVDHVFNLPKQEWSAPVCWFAIVCFSLQIYLDFSGYSDMAIGLGRMLGFPFPENFDQPYRARSVTEFWRRWHMTLTRWFRDYVYIPLGGNRISNGRTYLNLCVVFLLCGLWHGAALTFVVWGAYHGLLLALERALRTLTGWQPKGGFGTAVTFLLVMIGWVPFRAASVADTTSFLASMLGLHTPSVVFYPLSYYATPANLTYLGLGIAVALIPYQAVRAIRLDELSVKAVRFAGAFAILMLSIITLSTNSFRPFIYFQF